MRDILCTLSGLSVYSVLRKSFYAAQIFVIQSDFSSVSAATYSWHCTANVYVVLVRSQMADILALWFLVYFGENVGLRV